MLECIKEHPSALAEDHRVLNRLLSVFENGIGCSVCGAMAAADVCVCMFGTRREGCCGSTLA